MSPKKVAPIVSEENESELVIKPVKDIKEIKENAKIMEQSIVDDEYEEEEIDINPQKYITVISLYSGQLNLSTLPGGKGKVFTFDAFGQPKKIMYQNLVDVMESYPRFMNEGFYYIADKKVQRRHGLDEVYSKLLTKKMIEDIFTENMTDEDAGAMYKSASKQQQSTIIDLIVRKLVSQTVVDMNLVSTISRISGIDIAKKVEEDKFYLQSRQVA